MDLSDCSQVIEGSKLAVCIFLLEIPQVLSLSDADPPHEGSWTWCLRMSIFERRFDDDEQGVL